VSKHGLVSDESMIVAVILLLRVMKKKVPFTHCTWKRILLGCVLIASKIGEDRRIFNLDFVSLFPSLSSKLIGRIETEILKILDFNVTIRSSEYALTYFDVRSDIKSVTDNHVCNRESLDKLKGVAKNSPLRRTKSQEELIVIEKKVPEVPKIQVQTPSPDYQHPDYRRRTSSFTPKTSMTKNQSMTNLASLVPIKN